MGKSGDVARDTRLRLDSISDFENGDFARDVARGKWGKVGMLLGIPDYGLTASPTSKMGILLGT